MQFLYKLIKKSQHSPKGLWLLNLILKRSIPFNKPHQFKVLQITDESVTTIAPYQKRNFNHLKGIHACAIATVGELAAGLCLMNHFSPKKYRFIMSHLEVQYHYQAKKTIYAHAMLNHSDREIILSSLAHEEQTFFMITTEVSDADQQAIATVKTMWQIKDWKKVRTRL